jgi:MarR family transcriptional regulator, organic hydroperoxide resistance regulator
MYPSVLGLGAKLRAILALLDGDVQQIYDSRGVRFRPRFFPIVRVLLRAGPSRVGDIASAIRVTQPAATQTIAEMRKLGLLENAPSADRRETRVALTPAGTQLARDLVPIWQAVEASAAALEQELTVPLHQLLDEAIAALEALPFHKRIEDRLASPGAAHA